MADLIMDDAVECCFEGSAVGLMVTCKDVRERHEVGETVSIDGNGLLAISGVDGQTRLSKQEAKVLVHLLEWFIDKGEEIK